MTTAVSLHNIPLGIEIFSALSNNKSKRITTMIFLTISAFLGSLIIHLSSIVIPEIILGSLIAITMGMLIYISILELLPEIISHKDIKETSYGLCVGIIILLVAMFI